MSGASINTTNFRSAMDKRVAAIGDGVKAALHALRVSLSPSQENAWLAEAQLRLYRIGTRRTTLMMPAAALLTSLAFRPWVGDLKRNVWWIGIACLTLALHLIGNRLDRLKSNDAETVGFKSKIYVAMAAIFYTAWCSMSIVFWVPNAPIDQMLLVLILACSLAGTLVISVAHPGSAAVALIIHTLFLIGPTAIGGSDLDRMLSLLSGMFVVLVVSQATGLTVGINRMLKLEHERAGLVQNLRIAKQESDRDRGRAVAAGRAKSQFLSNMNHELRTPMNAILGFSDLIKSKAFGDDVEKYAEYAAIINDSGNHLLSLIDGMLDLAKIEGGKLTLHEAEVDLAFAINSAVQNAEETAHQTRVSLISHVARGLPRVFADERGLRQIIANLLSNAIKFTQAGGCVTVFAQVEPDGRIAFGVEDNGIGIASEDQEHVFERFGRGRHDVTTHAKGTGLGLAIVKGFAEAHDGSVSLDSAVGSGTRVTVYLPRDRVVAQEGTRLSA